MNYKCHYCQGHYEYRILWRGMSYMCDKCHENKRLKVEIKNLKEDTGMDSLKEIEGLKLSLSYYQDECDKHKGLISSLNEDLDTLKYETERLEAELEDAKYTIQSLAYQYGHSFV